MIINTEKIIVPNWFNKEQLENLLGKEISQLDFDYFRYYINDESDIADKISEMIIEEFDGWKK